MLILGTGYIGIEFANIFSNYGTKVTMLQILLILCLMMKKSLVSL